MIVIRKGNLPVLYNEGLGQTGNVSTWSGLVLLAGIWILVNILGRKKGFGK